MKSEYQAGVFFHLHDSRECVPFAQGTKNRDLEKETLTERPCWQNPKKDFEQFRRTREVWVLNTGDVAKRDPSVAT